VAKRCYAYVSTLLSLRHKDNLACTFLAFLAEKQAIETQILVLPAPIAKIHFFPKIPRDLRHHARIDYQALSKVID
jgi:hypothetical protein